MTNHDDEAGRNPDTPSDTGGEGAGQREATRRLSEMTTGSEAAMATIAAELDQRAPPPASQSAHAVWMGALVAVLYLAGSRGIGADTPVISLLSIAVAAGLIFGLTWFQERAEKRGHALGRKEMGRAIAKQLGEGRVAEARKWLDREG